MKNCTEHIVFLESQFDPLGYFGKGIQRHGVGSLRGLPWPHLWRAFQVRTQLDLNTEIEQAAFVVHRHNSLQRRI